MCSHIAQENNTLLSATSSVSSSFLSSDHTGLRDEYARSSHHTIGWPRSNASSFAHPTPLFLAGSCCLYSNGWDIQNADGSIGNPELGNCSILNFVELEASKYLRKSRAMDWFLFLHFVPSSTSAKKEHLLQGFRHRLLFACQLLSLRHHYHTTIRFSSNFKIFWVNFPW